MRVAGAHSGAFGPGPARAGPPLRAPAARPRIIHHLGSTQGRQGRGPRAESAPEAPRPPPRALRWRTWWAGAWHTVGTQSMQGLFRGEGRQDAQGAALWASCSGRVSPGSGQWRGGGSGIPGGGSCEDKDLEMAVGLEMEGQPLRGPLRRSVPHPLHPQPLCGVGRKPRPVTHRGRAGEPRELEAGLGKGLPGSVGFLEDPQTQCSGPGSHGSQK